MQLKIELEFMGHYDEPNLEIIHEYNGKSDEKTTYYLSIDPYVKEWAVCK